MVAILDYGMGNLRSVEKALERVGTEAQITHEPDAIRESDGLILPGVGAFPRAITRARARARRSRHRAARSRNAGARDLPRASAPVRFVGRERGRRGDRIDARPRRAAGGGGPQGAPHRVVASALGAPSALTEVGPGHAVLLRALVHAEPGQPRRSSRHGRTESGSRAPWSARRCTGCSSIPRSRAPRGCACSRTSPGSAPRSAPPLDPLSRYRYPGRAGRAAAARRVRRGDRLRQRSRRRGTPLGRTGRALPARGRSRRSPRGRPANLDAVRRIIDTVGVPVQVGGGLRDAAAVADVLAAGAQRAILGTAAHSDPELLRELVARHGERIVASVDARAGSVAVSGWRRETETSVAELLDALAAQGVRRFVYTPVEVDGTLEGPSLGDLRLVAEAVSGEVIYSGGVGSLDPARPRRIAAGQSRRGDRRPRPVRAQVRGRRGSARPGRGSRVASRRGRSAPMADHARPRDQLDRAVRGRAVHLQARETALDNLTPMSEGGSASWCASRRAAARTSPSERDRLWALVRKAMAG